MRSFSSLRSATPLTLSSPLTTQLFACLMGLALTPDLIDAQVLAAVGFWTAKVKFSSYCVISVKSRCMSYEVRHDYDFLGERNQQSFYFVIKTQSQGNFHLSPGVIIRAVSWSRWRSFARASSARSIWASSGRNSHGLRRDRCRCQIWVFLGRGPLGLLTGQQGAIKVRQEGGSWLKEPAVTAIQSLLANTAISTVPLSFDREPWSSIGIWTTHFERGSRVHGLGAVSQFPRHRSSEREKLIPGKSRR